MLTVHHLGISQSDRIVWLCEELGLDYELVLHARDPETGMAPASYTALHPFGTAPVIVDDGRTLGESGAIIEYLIARHGGGRLRPTTEDAAFPDYLFWFHFSNGSLMPAAMVDMVAGLLGGGDHELVGRLRQRSERAYAMIEARLGAMPYFAGEAFTAADVMMLFPLTTLRAFVPRNLTPYPNLRAYLARIGERPAFRTAMAKADPGFEPMLS